MRCILLDFPCIINWNPVNQTKNSLKISLGIPNVNKIRQECIISIFLESVKGKAVSDIFTILMSLVLFYNQVNMSRWIPLSQAEVEALKKDLYITRLALSQQVCSRCNGCSSTVCQDHSDEVVGGFIHFISFPYPSQVRSWRNVVLVDVVAWFYLQRRKPVRGTREQRSIGYRLGACNRGRHASHTLGSRSCRLQVFVLRHWILARPTKTSLPVRSKSTWGLSIWTQPKFNILPWISLKSFVRLFLCVLTNTELLGPNFK